MKDLLDIQQELAALEQQANNLSSSLRQVRTEVDELRTADKKPENEMDYAKIERLAKKLPFGSHPMSNMADARTRRMYLEMLLNIVRLEMKSDATLDRLVFVQWLQMQFKTEPLETLMARSLRATEIAYDDFVSTIPSEEYRNNFILDALLVANIGGTASHEVLVYVADLAEVLKVQKDELQGYCMIAKIILTQSLSGISESKHNLKLLFHTLTKKLTCYCAPQLQRIVTEKLAAIKAEERRRKKEAAEQEKREKIAEWRKTHDNRDNSLTGLIASMSNMGIRPWLTDEQVWEKIQRGE